MTFIVVGSTLAYEAVGCGSRDKVLSFGPQKVKGGWPFSNFNIGVGAKNHLNVVIVDVQVLSKREAKAYIP